MRLIDADAIAPKLEGTYNQTMVRYAPKIDAVPVVRCKDCIHQTHDGNDTPYCLSLEMYLNKELDFFCSYGERKEGAD